MAVYLLRYEAPLGHFRRPGCHARYYLGYADDDKLFERFREHAAGRGAAITRAWAAAGVGFTVARVWWGEGRAFERLLKNRGHYDRLDPAAPRRCDPPPAPEPRRVDRAAVASAALSLFQTIGRVRRALDRQAA